MFQVLPSPMRPSASTNSASSNPACIATRRAWNSGKVSMCLTCGKGRENTVLHTRSGETGNDAGGAVLTSSTGTSGRSGRRGSKSGANAVTRSAHSPPA